MKIQYWVLFGSVAILILALVLFASAKIRMGSQWFFKHAMPFGLTMLIFGVVGAFSNQQKRERYRKMKLILGKDTLILAGVDEPKVIRFKAIDSLTSYENPFGLLVKCSGKKYFLFGYEKMDEIVEKVASKVKPSAVKRVRRSTDMSKPIHLIWVVPISLVVVVALILVVWKFGFYIVFQRVSTIFCGLYLAFFLPDNAPKSSRQLGWAIIILGVLILFLR